ncbi:adhesion G protein-coupled receptor B2 [Trichonephila clavipes]|nr:adhesion G protein-coupled receptor B2 [Trichonephila clavipes]
MPSLSVLTNDVVSQMFIECSELKHVVAIHYGMSALWAGLVNSQAKPVEVYYQEVMSVVLKQKQAKTSGLSKCLEIGPTVARVVSPGFLRLLIYWVKRYRTLNCNETMMYYSIDMNFFYSKDNLVALHFKYDFWHMTATAGSDVVQSGRPIFDDFLQHLWQYIGNNTANDVFQMVKCLWLIRIDQ